MQQSSLETLQQTMASHLSEEVVTHPQKSRHEDNMQTTSPTMKRTIDTHALDPIAAEETYAAATSTEAPVIPPEDSPTTLDKRSTLRISLIITALFLSLFVAALDATIVATSVPVICADLNSATGYVWIGASYLIANAVSSPIWAKLSDIWGRKVIMLAALVIFAASSAMCGAAKDMKLLIAGRAVQGVAGGGLMLLVHVIISDLFSMRMRSLVMGATEGVWCVDILLKRLIASC
jgi:Na+/melibiose symporter-like transporter